MIFKMNLTKIMELQWINENLKSVYLILIMFSDKGSVYEK